MPRYHHRRAWLRSFWLIVSSSAGLACGLLVGGVSRNSLGVAALVAMGLALPGWMWPHATSPIFRAWCRLSKVFAGAVRWYVTRVCLYMILPSVRLAGSTMKMDRPSSHQSGWMRRPHPQTLAYHSLADLEAHTPAESNWLHAYLAWARRSRRLWSLGLIPLLLLAAAVEEDVEMGAPSHDIYTLY